MSDIDDDAPTIPADVAEGRAPVLDLASAQAIAAANEAAGFPPPPAAQAVIDAAKADARQARKAAKETPTPAPGAGQQE